MLENKILHKCEITEIYKTAQKIEQITAFNRTEPNVLLLDYARFSVDDGEIQDWEEILRADNKIRKQLGIENPHKCSIILNGVEVDRIDNFEIKYSNQVGERFLLSQKDVGKIGTLNLKPIYMILFLLKNLR